MSNRSVVLKQASVQIEAAIRRLEKQRTSLLLKVQALQLMWHLLLKWQRTVINFVKLGLQKELA